MTYQCRRGWYGTKGSGYYFSPTYLFDANNETINDVSTTMIEIPGSSPDVYIRATSADTQAIPWTPSAPIGSPNMYEQKFTGAAVVTPHHCYIALSPTIPAAIGFRIEACMLFDDTTDLDAELCVGIMGSVAGNGGIADHFLSFNMRDGGETTFLQYSLDSDSDVYSTPIQVSDLPYNCELWHQLRVEYDPRHKLVKGTLRRPETQQLGTVLSHEIPNDWDYPEIVAVLIGGSADDANTYIRTSSVWVGNRSDPWPNYGD